MGAHLFNRVAYSWFRKSKASRAYENAVRISQLGFDTPAPIAYLETYTNGLLHDTYFVSLQCPYMRQIKEFAEDSPIGDRTSIVEALGRYVANSIRPAFTIKICPMATSCLKPIQPGRAFH